MTRSLVLLSAFALSAFAQDAHLTARQVIERIQKNVGVPWRSPTHR